MKTIYSTMLTLLCLTSLALAMPRVAYAQEPVTLTDEQQSYTLQDTQLAYLEDPTAQLTIEQILSPEWADSFIVYPTANPSFPKTNSVYWFRLHLTNKTLQRDWRLEVIKPNSRAATALSAKWWANHGVATGCRL